MSDPVGRKSRWWTTVSCAVGERRCTAGQPWHSRGKGESTRIDTNLVDCCLKFSTFAGWFQKCVKNASNTGITLANKNVCCALVAAFNVYPTHNCSSVS